MFQHILAPFMKINTSLNMSFKNKNGNNEYRKLKVLMAILYSKTIYNILK